MRYWLVEIRKKAKMNQQSVSDAVGIKQASYCNIENGKRQPSVKCAKAIAKVLSFDWSMFFDDNS